MICPTLIIRCVPGNLTPLNIYFLIVFPLTLYLMSILEGAVLGTVDTVCYVTLVKHI